MKNQTKKKVILWLAALVLLVTSCATAFASPGDRTIRHTSMLDSSYYENIEAVYRNGDGFGAMVTDQTGKYMLVYADAQSEPEKYYLEEYNRDPYGSFEEEENAAEALTAGELPEAGEQENGEQAAEAETGFEGKPEAIEPDAADPATEEKQEDAEAASGDQPAVEGLLSLDDIDWSDEALNDETAQFAVPEGEYFAGEGEFPEGMDFQFEPEPYYNVSNYFSWNGELYGIAIGQTWDQSGMSSTLDGIKVQSVRLENGQVICEDTDLPEWDYEKLASETEDYGLYLENINVSGDKLIARTWAADGQKIIEIDLKTGAVSVQNITGNLVGFCAGPEGSVILGVYDWETQKGSVVRKNLSDGKEETLVEYEKGSESMGLSYDAETDMLYMLKDGELWKGPMADLTKLEAVNDSPLSDGNIIAMQDGFVLIWDRNNILIRNTDPSVRGTIALHVEDNSINNMTIDESVFALNEKRGDLSVIVRQQYDWMSKSNVLTDMMNKDGSTDIYVLPYEGTDFNALKNRGYLADLSDNAEIAEKVNRMYPYMQDALKQDGKIIGVPVGLAGQSFGINYTAWEHIGGTEEELPKTWNQFFEWLEKLPERLEGTEGCITDNPYAGSMMSDLFFSSIVYQYQMQKDSKGEKLVFNTPELKDMLTRLNSIDFRSLGVKSWDDMEGNGYMLNENYIISTEFQQPLGSNYMYGDARPLPLSLKEGEDPILPVTIYVAVVNPFSEHVKEAGEFLALVMDNLEIRSEFAFFADKTEPVRYSTYEESRKSYEKWLEEARKRLEKAEEGVDKIQAEDEVKMWEEELERLDNESWQVSPKQLEQFQKILPFCKVLDHDFQKEVQSTLSQADMQLMAEEEDDNINLEKLLNLLDQKIQMVRDEGK